MNLVIGPSCKSLKNTKIIRKRQGLTHLVQKLWNTNLQNPSYGVLADENEEKMKRILDIPIWSHFNLANFGNFLILPFFHPFPDFFSAIATQNIFLCLFSL